MMYAKDWQCCERCGCTMPESALLKGRRIDDILRLDTTTWICLDDKRCARLKVERAEALSAERDIRDYVQRRIHRGEQRIERKAAKKAVPR